MTQFLGNLRFNFSIEFDPWWLALWGTVGTVALGILARIKLAKKLHPITLIAFAIEAFCFLRPIVDYTHMVCIIHDYLYMNNKWHETYIKA